MPGEPREPVEAVRYLRDIEPISFAPGERVSSREELEELVEPPLLRACQMLFDKNVHTTVSSANKNNLINGRVSFAVDYGSLSDDNKKIVDRLNAEYKATLEPGQLLRPGGFVMRVNTETTEPEIEAWSLSIAQQFQQQ